eukprot:CAMPEP_0174386588 /NCGR_PEP_ID=MMETSP0811_2-20130205/127376_1 /TAXON_ID=73025 ORGANISM="Eutreptiella gymnastica-like, Strain CCMP1594" /NCGR_SAMPLE_ID=MMETSP0811_2 /ASSEMBLY_ACC=CAM_ASM_000667 /LENGTH=209 /DNA_ID=CAMNT_0015541311 /DNA_START=2035 /DNA_END=2664 /DNA_ORIENTATION=+
MLQLGAPLVPSLQTTMLQRHIRWSATPSTKQTGRRKKQRGRRSEMGMKGNGDTAGPKIPSGTKRPQTESAHAPRNANGQRSTHPGRPIADGACVRRGVHCGSTCLCCGVPVSACTGTTTPFEGWGGALAKTPTQTISGRRPPFGGGWVRGGAKPSDVAALTAVGGVNGLLVTYEDEPKPLRWPTVSVPASLAGRGTNTLKGPHGGGIAA